MIEYKLWKVYGRIGDWTAQGTYSNWSTGAQDDTELEAYLKKKSLKFGVDPKADFDELDITLIEYKK